VKVYEAVARREHPYWVVTVEGVGVTQGRSLAESVEMAADLVGVMTGEDPADFDVKMRVELSGEMSARLDESRRLSEEAARLQLVAAEATREAVVQLRDVGRLTGRDIAKVLGVSEQRVSQIAARRSASSEQRSAPPPSAQRRTGALCGGATESL